MEKIIKQVTAFKQIPDGTRDIISFVASDGKEFTGNYAEQACSTYEKGLADQIIRQQVKTVPYDTDVVNLPTIWYFPTTVEQLELIKKDMGYYKDYIDIEINGLRENEIFDEGIKINEWFGCDYCDGGDSPDRLQIYTWTFVKAEFSKLEKRLSE